MSLVKSISQDTIVTFSGIITRVDNNGKYIDKVVKVNKLIMDVLEKLNVEVIDNVNIKSEHLAKKGLHLSSGKGNAKLATNLKQVIKMFDVNKNYPIKETVCNTFQTDIQTGQDDDSQTDTLDLSNLTAFKQANLNNPFISYLNLNSLRYKIIDVREVLCKAQLEIITFN